MQLKPLLAFIFLLFFNVCMRSDVFSIAVIVICYAVNAFNIVSDVIYYAVGAFNYFIPKTAA
jgi:ABC-type microcin C transport system permease subunit YejB